MKKKLFLPLLALTATIFAVSCSKSDSQSTTSGSVSLDGKWVGTYNNGAGGPVNYFALTFKSGGALVVHANNSLTPDIANGTWMLVADSVKASYSYVGSSAIYAMSAKYSSTSNIMAGTVGLSPDITGEAVFSVTKQP
ncbi:MAG TPA: hypothetical protein PKJ94_10665 [Ferruginibacter sp.]|nr:hypothetical protein [Ferruginibacter sp.]